MSMNHHAFILHNFKPDEILDNLDGNITWIPFRFYNQYLHPPNHFYQHILISLNISSLLHEIPEFMIILDMITECMWHLSTSDRHPYSQVYIHLLRRNVVICCSNSEFTLCSFLLLFSSILYSLTVSPILSTAKTFTCIFKAEHRS